MEATSKGDLLKKAQLSPDWRKSMLTLDPRKCFLRRKKKMKHLAYNICVEEELWKYEASMEKEKKRIRVVRRGVLKKEKLVRFSCLDNKFLMWKY
ncbi:hypothetical protein Q3G72_011396 [Acer saccharum]|nr:hypothetical protein Q3G72_011396 [Acer saccharum]